MCFKVRKLKNTSQTTPEKIVNRDIFKFDCDKNDDVNLSTTSSLPTAV